MLIRKKNICGYSSNKIIPISTNLQLSGRYSILIRKTPTYLRIPLKKINKILLTKNHIWCCVKSLIGLSFEMGNTLDNYCLNSEDLHSQISSNHRKTFKSKLRLHFTVDTKTLAENLFSFSQFHRKNTRMCFFGMFPIRRFH